MKLGAKEEAETIEHIGPKSRKETEGKVTNKG